MKNVRTNDNKNNNKIDDKKLKGKFHCSFRTIWEEAIKFKNILAETNDSKQVESL